ncbi:MAG: ferrous iron transport protein B [Legionellaceae bacterium]
MTRFLLVGNPNCGKTTLFNALTGDHERVGNWPGVTVDVKSKQLAWKDQVFEVMDLPGLYSLEVFGTEALSQDEQQAKNALRLAQPDGLINVIDACQLERHLYLTSQLLELGHPMVVVLNKMDCARERGLTIDIHAMSALLGCPVLPMEAHRHQGVEALKDVLLTPIEKPTPLTLVGGMTEDDIVMADRRYTAVHEVVLKVQKKRSDVSEYLTEKLDRFILNRFLAYPIFFLVMYGLFFFAIHVGGFFQPMFDRATSFVFVEGAAHVFEMMHAPDWFVAWGAYGIGKGINTTLTFIPVMAALYFFLSLLEGSGYMARAAFVVDRAMRYLGLPGKSFVPMIIGFGCNVPAVMAGRTLDSDRDRLLTILMSPFMSCSARLAIYSIFAATFFPDNGQYIVFSLYFLGVFMAVLTGFLLRKTVFKGETSSLILELPAYHRPSLGRLFKDTADRVSVFIFRAGKLIIPVCAVLGAMNALSTDGHTLSSGDTHSLLAYLGQWITPCFEPMGLTPERWPATVALMTGMLAKEVVIGTLNGLHVDLYHLFDGQVGAYAYLLFVLFYIPCVSTMAVIRQEASRKLMWFSIGWSTLVAYSAAVLFYQLATFERHEVQSLTWVLVIALVNCFVVYLIQLSARKSEGGSHAVTAS